MAAVVLDPEDEYLRDMISVQSCARGKLYATLLCQKLHRLLTDAPKGTVVDHINGDTLDNRKANLRVVTQAVNMRNMGGAFAGRDLPLGVTRKGRFFRALIRHGGALLHLGQYTTPEEANLARLRKEQELWGIQPRRLPAFQAAGLA